MKKTIKNLVGVALALVMCLTMAPETTVKADEAVALSEYTEEQLLEVMEREWYNPSCEEVVLSKTHVKIVEYTLTDELNTVLDTDWVCEGLVTLDKRIVTMKDLEIIEEGEYTVTTPVAYKNGVWVDEAGNPFTLTDEHYLNDIVGYVGDIKVKTSNEELTGKWKDADYNEYETADVTDITATVYEFIEADESEAGSSTKALKFTAGDDTFYFYRGIGYNLDYDPVAVLEYGETLYKFIGAEETVAEIFESVLENKTEEPTPAPTETPVEEPTPAPTETPVEEPTPAPTKTPVEEPTVEEPTVEEPTVEESTVEEPTVEEPTVEEPTVEEPKEDTVTENTEVIGTTSDGREVYTGETIHIVKKGDCLWAIAKHYLGNGRLYVNLFTRNNGVIRKAELIFPGQEVIIPVLKIN